MIFLIYFDFKSLIEANVDVKTTDGYLLRIFCIGFTNKDQLSTRKTCYAQHTQVIQISLKNADGIEIETDGSISSELHAKRKFLNPIFWSGNRALKKKRRITIFIFKLSYIVCTTIPKSAK